MSNSQPLRRSRRGQKQAYGPGDRVEVVRDEGVAIGRLVRKVDQDLPETSEVDHWIVSFEGDTEEHEVTEKYIGRLVESTDTESVKSGVTPPPRSSRSTKATILGTAAAVPTSLHGSSNHNNSKSKKSSKSPPRKASRSHDREARPSTRSAIKQGGKEKALLKGIKATKKPAKKSGSSKLGENETVVKVKMLTGTLYLYRGENRRAEFVRTV